MQCVFVSAELEQGLMAQLKSVISRRGGLYCLELLVGERSFGSLNPERPNLLISAPSFRPRASISCSQSSGLKRQIRLFSLLGPLKTLLDFSHNGYNGYLIPHLIIQTKTGHTYIAYKVSTPPPPLRTSPFLHTSHVVLILWQDHSNKSCWAVILHCCYELFRIGKELQFH